MFDDYDDTDWRWEQAQDERDRQAEILADALGIEVEDLTDDDWNAWEDAQDHPSLSAAERNPSLR